MSDKYQELIEDIEKNNEVWNSFTDEQMEVVDKIMDEYNLLLEAYNDLAEQSSLLMDLEYESQD